MAGENIPIYYVKYETMIRAGCEAIIAIREQSTVKGLLEKVLEQDDTVREDSRKDVAGTLKIWGVKRTGYNSDKEGVIYFSK